ncbi:MAG: hypothetical protein U1E05_25215 [Patescibacteria group bacterium]|nr:hypothetical protein [Patescibacteria group bacterium]
MKAAPSQLLQLWPQFGKETAEFGLHQSTDRANIRYRPGIEFPAPCRFVHDNQFGTQLSGQSDYLPFTPVEVIGQGGSKRRIGYRFDVNPVGGSRFPRAPASFALIDHLIEHGRGNQDSSIQRPEQVKPADCPEIDQRRRVDHDDHGSLAPNR